MNLSYYQSPKLKAAGLPVVQISNGAPRWGEKPVAKLELVCPPIEIVHTGLDEAAFRRKYIAHLDSVGAPAILKAIGELRAAHGETLCFCCFEALKTPGQFCHRTMLGKWLARHGVTVAEL
jgi:hypothetical protein